MDFNNIYPESHYEVLNVDKQLKDDYIHWSVASVKPLFKECAKHIQQKYGYHPFEAGFASYNNTVKTICDGRICFLSTWVCKNVKIN